MRNLRHPVSMLLRTAAIAILMLCGTWPTATADELQDCLIVHMHSGAKVSYVLETTPKVTFVADKLHVETTALSDDHTLADVSKFTFDKLSSLGSVTAGECRITVIDATVTIEGIAPQAVVTLADMQGRTLASASADSTGMARLSLATAPDGVYLISVTDGRTFKIFKK